MQFHRITQYNNNNIQQYQRKGQFSEKKKKNSVIHGDKQHLLVNVQLFLLDQHTYVVFLSMLLTVQFNRFVSLLDFHVLLLFFRIKYMHQLQQRFLCPIQWLNLLQFLQELNLFTLGQHIYMVPFPENKRGFILKIKIAMPNKFRFSGLIPTL